MLFIVWIDSFKAETLILLKSNKAQYDYWMGETLQIMFSEVFWFGWCSPTTAQSHKNQETTKKKKTQMTTCMCDLCWVCLQGWNVWNYHVHLLETARVETKCGWGEVHVNVCVCARSYLHRSVIQALATATLHVCGMS